MQPNPRMFLTNQKTQLGSTFLEEPATMEPGPSLQGTNGSHSKGHSPVLSRQDFLPVPCLAAAPGPGSDTGSGKILEKPESSTWRSPAHLGAAHPFTPTQLPNSRHLRKEEREEKGLICMQGRRAQDCPRWPLPSRGSLPPKGRQMRMCKESCSSSRKALEVTFAADMTVQNH